jgi:hypothetical protein
MNGGEMTIRADLLISASAFQITAIHAIRGIFGEWLSNDVVYNVSSAYSG